MEKILCSAVYRNDGKKHPHQPRNVKEGFVVGGLRHCNCIAVIASLTGDPVRRPEDLQGFLTTSNRFVNRYVAFKIAKKAKQLLRPRIIREVPSQLYSEDLW